MIVDAPRFNEIAIGEDGLPVWISVPDPRWFAAHKLWLSSAPGREAIKRGRDHQQAEALASLLANCWEEIDLSDEALASIPKDLRHQFVDLVKTSKSEPSSEW